MTNILNMSDYIKPKYTQNNCCDVYYEIVQMIDEWHMFKDDIESFYNASLVFRKSLSENPSDCYEDTLDGTALKLIDEILNPTTELINLFNITIIEEIYDAEDKELLEKMSFIIFSVMHEYKRLARHYISIQF